MAAPHVLAKNRVSVTQMLGLNCLLLAYLHQAGRLVTTGDGICDNLTISWLRCRSCVWTELQANPQIIFIGRSFLSWERKRMRLTRLTLIFLSCVCGFAAPQLRAQHAAQAAKPRPR